MVGAGICASHDERELMISRRTFILHGAIALLPLPTPLPKTDPYDQFLNAVRERVIQLARDGFVVERLVILPPRDGRRTVNAWCEDASEPITFSVRYDVR
jgi:hypothetical protein